MKNKILSVTILGLLTSTLYAEEPPTKVEFVRPLGMGGAFTAIADDHNIFAYNPAGLVQRTGSQFTLLEIAGGGAKDTKDFIDFVEDNEAIFNDWDNADADDITRVTNEIANNISKLDPRVYAAANVFSYLSGPVFWGAHIGFGVQGVIDSSVRLDPGVPAPTISFNVNNDIVVPFTLAKRWDAPLLPGKLGVGATAKLMFRNKTQQEQVSVLGMDDIGEPPVSQGDGWGGDLGLLYQPTDRTNIGVMVQDIGGTKLHFDAEPAKNGFNGYPERDTVIRPRTNIGMAMTPKSLLWLLPTGDRWIFSADIKDIFPSEASGEHVLFQEGFSQILGDDFGEHFYLGTEFRYWFLRLRGGAYQGYPTAGIGMDFPIIKLDFAYYGREIGTFAGDRRQDNYIASLALSFGGSNVEARDRIVKNKDMTNQKSMGEPSPTEAAPTPAAPEAPAPTPEAAPAPVETPKTAPAPAEEIPQ